MAVRYRRLRVISFSLRKRNHERSTRRLLGRSSCLSREVLLQFIDSAGVVVAEALLVVDEVVFVVDEDLKIFKKTLLLL